VACVLPLALALLSGCTPEPVSDKAQVALPIIVYAAYDDKNYLPQLFEEFSRDTGNIVTVRNGTVPAIVDDVLQNRVSPPADVLLTPTVVGVWRAAEEGELRPIYSPTVADRVPAELRDPDNFWVAVSVRNANIVYDADKIAAAELASFEQLANADIRGQLCLSSSSLGVNRGVIAVLLRKLGVRETELLVRSWVANLALPPFASEAELLSALESGACAVGIVSSNVPRQPGSALSNVAPTNIVATAEAIGITRHARNPDGAAALIDWLLQKSVQERHAAAMAALPVGADVKISHALVVVASGDEEARRLAERARYR
jgi:iron(III) transport system substrate-binding protein